ncbi:MAG: hypothetical protein Q8M37_07975 [Nevskia sp.]|nr:hypothetical protein [Nevskia sp.]
MFASRRGFVAIVLSGVLSLGMYAPAWAQASAGCDWYEAPVNLAYPETNARYYQVDLPVRPPSGSRIRIEGEYLATRYFSFQIYDSRYAPIDELSDYKLVPDTGSESTLLGPSATNPDVAPGGRYTAVVNYGTVKTVKPKNTLYTGAGITSSRKFRLVLRTYLEESQVSLPKIVLETPTGDRPLGGGLCRSSAGQPSETGLPMLDSLLLPKPPDEPVLLSGIPSPSRNVPFAVYYGAQTGNSEFGVNKNAAYMSATVRNRGELVLIRGRAPSFRERTGTTPAVPDVRYWSFCQNNLLLTTVVACRADREIPVNDNGNYYVVIADNGAPRLPSNSGYAMLPYTSALSGFVIYRQLLPAEDFVGAINTVPRGTAPKKVIGDYAPTATYCPVSLFQSSFKAGKTPDQIYAACAAAR